MSAFPFAAIASGISDLAGSLISASASKKAAKKAAKAQWKYQEKMYLRGPQLMVEGAKRAGLHPLAVLGGNWNAGGVAPVSGQSTWGDAVGSALQTASNAYSEYSSRRDQARAEADARAREHFELSLAASREARENRLAAAQVQAYEADAFRNRTEAFMMSAQDRTKIAAARNAAIGAAPPSQPLDVGGPGAIPMPFGLPPFPVAKSKLGQTSEDAFSETGELVTVLEFLERLYQYGQSPEFQIPKGQRPGDIWRISPEQRRRALERRKQMPSR